MLTTAPALHVPSPTPSSRSSTPPFLLSYTAIRILQLLQLLRRRLRRLLLLPLLLLLLLQCLLLPATLLLHMALPWQLMVPHTSPTAPSPHPPMLRTFTSVTIWILPCVNRVHPMHCVTRLLPTFKAVGSAVRMLRPRVRGGRCLVASRVDASVLHSGG